MDESKFCLYMLTCWQSFLYEYVLLIFLEYYLEK